MVFSTVIFDIFKTNITFKIVSDENINFLNVMFYLKNVLVLLIGNIFVLLKKLLPLINICALNYRSTSLSDRRH